VNELVVPFTRSVVGVADASAGLFSYSSSADVGNLALRVAGTLTNSTAAQYFGGGVPVMSLTSQALDVIMLTAAAAGNFDVTMQLVVHGSLVPSSQSRYVAANSQLLFGLYGGPNGSDSARYVDSVIDDVLSVTRTVAFAAPGATASVDFNALLSFTVTGVLPGETVSGDLSNTASLNLILPPELQVTGSLSGTYGVPIPIPEPQTYLLMLAGIVLVGARARRRR